MGAPKAGAMAAFKAAVAISVGAMAAAVVAASVDTVVPSAPSSYRYTAALVAAAIAARMAASMGAVPASQAAIVAASMSIVTAPLATMVDTSIAALAVAFIAAVVAALDDGGDDSDDASVTSDDDAHSTSDGGDAINAASGATNDINAAIPADDMSPPPLLVLVLGCNPVTALTVFACLTAGDATILRRLHPTMAAAVARVPWTETSTPVRDVVRWRAALPAAAGAYVTRLCRPGKLARMLAGVHTLDLHACAGVTDAMLSSLPPSLRVLIVSECRALTPFADFTHLTALTSLDCSNTAVVAGGLHRLPPSLCELNMDNCALPPTADFHQLPSLQLLSSSTSPAAGTASAWLHGVSLAHLTQLRVLRVSFSGLDDGALASLPASLLELNAWQYKALTPAASFAHLTQLRELDVTLCSISDASLTSLPPSLVSLKALNCPLTPAAVLPHLPLLQVVEVSLTAAGDALVASLPYGLAELGLADCARVTRAAKLGHLLGLRVLHCSATSVSPDELAARRARGCVAPAAAVLRAHTTPVHSMAMLANGRLASGDMGGWIVMGDTVVRDAAGTTLREVGTTPVRAMVALPNRRLALGTVGLVFPDGGIDVWDVDVRRPVRKAARRWGCGVPALAVLPDGCLAAGFLNGVLRFVDVSAGPPAVVAAVKVHTGAVMALALLPGGMLASGSYDGTVRLWNVGTRACIGTLVSRPTAPPLCSMAVLADGRLACGANDGTVALWDVGARTCVGMLAGHQCGTTALLALPDGRLVSCDGLGAIRLWDTRPAAAEASVRAAGTPSMVTMEAGRIGIPIKALVLVGENRIATGHVSGPLRTWHVPPLPPA